VRWISLISSKYDGQIRRKTSKASSALPILASAMLTQGLLWQKMPPFSL
jgi:hypothetical protein